MNPCVSQRDFGKVKAETLEDFQEMVAKMGGWEGECLGSREGGRYDGATVGFTTGGEIQIAGGVK